MKRIAWTVVLAALVASPLPAAETVSLAYGWKPGIGADVALTGSKVRKGARGTRKQKLTGGYRLDTVAHERGLRIDFTDVRLEVETEPPAGGKRIQAFVNRLTTVTPAFVVDQTGQLVDIAGVDALRASIDAELGASVSAMPPPVQERMKKLVESLFSGNQLLIKSEESWNRDVAQWIGEPLEKGTTYEREQTRRVASFGGIALPMQVSYRYHDRAPCNAGDTARSCVHLILQASVSPEGLRPAFAEIYRRMGRKMPAKFAATMTYELQLVTEPDTLLPHRSKWIRTIANPRSGKQPGTEQVEVRELTYTYDAG